MPTWRTELPPEGKHRGLDLRRTPTNGFINAIVTSDHLLVCDTHYWHGRTTPCERQCNAEGKTTDDSHCPPCQEKAPWRSHVYVAAFDAKTREQFIFECTTHAAKPFAEHCAAAGTLRGCIFNATRPKATPNGKVSIMTHQADLSKTYLPEACNVAAALAVIWRLPRAALDLATEIVAEIIPATGRRPVAPHVRPRAALLAAMRNQPDNAGDPPTLGDILDGNGKAIKLRTVS